MILRLSQIKRFLASVNAWEYTPVCLLVLMVLILHFSTIMQPNGTVIDEHYYVPAAKEILNGSGLGRIEHPPLGQAIIAFGIGLFGDNPLGWRFFSVIFGSVSIALFYLICRQLRLSKYTSVLATFLLATDNLSFVQSGVAMLDVFSLTFVLLSFWLYLNRRYFLVGVAVGLAILSKLTGLVALPIIFLYWFAMDRKNIKRIMVVPIATSIASLFIFLPIMDFAIIHVFLNPFERLQYMFGAMSTVTFANYAYDPFRMVPSRPWEWLYTLRGASYLTWDTIQHQFIIHYMMMVNPSIWAFIIPSIVLLVYLADKWDRATIFILCWFTGSYLLWIPLSIVSNRLSYDYYFYPTVGAICMAISLVVGRIVTKGRGNFILLRLLRFLIPIYLGISLLFFVSLYTLYIGTTLFLTIWASILFLMVFYYLDKLAPTAMKQAE